MPVREMLGIKQEALALELGDNCNQRKISLLEQKETIESDLLEQKFEYYSLEVLKNASTWKLSYSNTYPWPE